jgi:hypothetical protein
MGTHFTYCRSELYLWTFFWCISGCMSYVQVFLTFILQAPHKCYSLKNCYVEMGRIGFLLRLAQGLNSCAEWECRCFILGAVSAFFICVSGSAFFFLIQMFNSWGWISVLKLQMFYFWGAGSAFFICESGSAFSYRRIFFCWSGSACSNSEGSSVSV